MKTIFIAAACLALAGCGKPTIPVAAPSPVLSHHTVTNGHIAPLAQDIVWSLEHEPELWRADGFHLWRPNGKSRIYIWIANGEDFVAIGCKDGTAGDIFKEPEFLYERSMIWAAYEQWKTNPEHMAEIEREFTSADHCSSEDCK